MDKPAKKRGKVLFFVLCFIFLLFITGCSGLQGDSSVKDNANLTNGQRTAEAKIGDIGTTISGSGLFVPVKLTNLSFKDMSGPLKKIYVKANDTIKAGTTVAEIDPQSVQQQITAQEMTMQVWEIRKLQNAENIAVSARSLKIAKMNVDSVNSRFIGNPSDENSQELERQRILYEQAVSADKNVKWNKAIADIQYKADLDQLQELKSQLANSVLKTPVDGIVTYVDDIWETEMVNSGRVIARIAEPRNIALQMVSTESSHLKNVKKGTLTIGLVNYEVELYQPQAGDLLSQLPSDSTVKNSIYVRFISKIPSFNLDNVVNAKLKIEKSNVLIIPKSALRDLNDKTMVDVVKGDVVSSVEVVRGLEENGNVEIISGLEAGQKVVLY